MKRSAPAVQRNREPLLEVLRTRLGSSVLELASGTGEHARFFTDALPHLVWQPTDGDPDALASIEAWREGANPGLLTPYVLDVRVHPWTGARFDSILACNLIHIAPWSVTQALMKGAAAMLHPGGRLFLYGPFKLEGRHTAPSNVDFDAWLEQTSPTYGVRDLEAVLDEAQQNGLMFEERLPMPANNFTVVIRSPG